MPYTTSVAPQTQSTKSSDSTNVSSDGVLFLFMLAAVAGIFLFKGKNQVSQKSSDTPLRYEGINLGVQEATNSVPLSSTSQHPIPNAQRPMTNDQVGQRIIEELVSTKLSTLLAAPSGAGKSVTQSYWLTKLFEKFSTADVYVIAQKNDSFNGLREQKKVFVYDTDNPKDALQALQIVHDIFKARKQFLEEERSQFAKQPVRLILADWYSIHNNLVKCHNKLWQTEIQSKLADIVTVAREFNVSLFADSQTYNLASLGLAEDSNIRNNLNIISQGLISIDEDGNEQGGFEVIQSIIRNAYIFPTEEVRRVINFEVEKLVKISNAQHIPMILSTAGIPKAGLLPDLMEYKGRNIFKVTTPIHPKAESTLSPAEGLTATDVLPEPLRTIWRACIERSQNVAQEKEDWLTARDIARKEYAALKGKNTAAEIIGFVQQLEKMGLVEISSEIGQAIRFRQAQTVKSD